MNKSDNALAITMKSHFVQAWPSIIYVIGFCIIPIYLSNKYTDTTIGFIVNLIFIISLFIFLPQIIIHTRYYKTNKDTQIRIKSGGEKFIIKSPILNREVDIDEIDTIEIVKSTSAYFNGFRVFPADNYFYGKIHLKSKESFLVTTLLDSELIWLSYLKPSVSTVKRAIFCIV